MRTIRVSDVDAETLDAVETTALEHLRANHPAGSLIEAAGADGPLIDPGIPTHPLVAAMHAAFQRHVPLTLRPDDVWLCVAAGVAAHVATDPDRYRERFVTHAGRQEIVIFRDDFTRGSPDNDWPGCFSDFGEKIEERTVGDWRARLACRFSTTTPAARAAADVVLMGTVAAYFQYVVWTRCGIPSVTLEGTPDDWTLVYRRARDLGLADLDLGWWGERLVPVLETIAATAHGAEPTEFWRSAYKFHDASGTAHVTGWVNALFPYVKGSGMGAGGRVRNPWVVNPDLPYYRCPSIDAFPGGFTEVPFTWRFGVSGRTSDVPMRFLGGHAGVAAAGAGVRPAIGWAVAGVG